MGHWQPDQPTRVAKPDRSLTQTDRLDQVLAERRAMLE